MPEKPDYPMALQPPASCITAIDETMIVKVKEASRESPRKRIILPLHKEGPALLQRMLNAIQPGSYIRPHRHSAERGESIVVLSGSILYFTFNDVGDIQERIELRGHSSQLGIDIEGGIWHCFIALEPDTVLFEVKPGPYNAATDKEFAPWAPEEYTPEATIYLETLQKTCSRDP